MGRRRLNNSEGNWFAVPLDSGGYGIGLAARIDGRGVILGYFFGERLMNPQSVADLPELIALDVIDISIFGDPGLLENRWLNLRDIGR